MAGWLQSPSSIDSNSLSVTEIRHYGRHTVQVTRRLRTMLDNLLQTYPNTVRPCPARSCAFLGLSVPAPQMS